jgi:hypothetical protein
MTITVTTVTTTLATTATTKSGADDKKAWNDMAVSYYKLRMQNVW